MQFKYRFQMAVDRDPGIQVEKMLLGRRCSAQPSCHDGICMQFMEKLRLDSFS